MDIRRSSLAFDDQAVVVFSSYLCRSGASGCEWFHKVLTHSAKRYTKKSKFLASVIELNHLGQVRANSLLYRYVATASRSSLFPSTAPT